MTIAYKALTSDIITRYSFGKSTNYVNLQDYNHAYFETFDNVFKLSHWVTHIGWLGWLLASLPTGIASRLMPGLEPLFKQRLVNSAT